MKTVSLLSIAVACMAFAPRFQQTDRIYGVWQSDVVKGVSAEMTIDANGNGTVKWSDDSLPYKFRYSRVNDSVVAFKTARMVTKHKIGKLTDDELHLRPIASHQQSVELIDEMAFVRKK